MFVFGNVTGNDTGNVSGTCKHIISNQIKLVNRNLVRGVWSGLKRFFVVLRTRKGMKSRIVIMKSRVNIIIEESIQPAKVCRNFTERRQVV